MTAGADGGGDLLTLLPGTAGAAPGAEWEALAELAAQLDRIALLAIPVVPDHAGVPARAAAR